MKNSLVFFGAIIYAFVILISCEANSNDKKGSDTTKANVETSKDNLTSPVSNIPLVKAIAKTDKYVDWGTRPLEGEDGPADPWTMPFMMCQGPPFLEGQLKASSTLAPNGKTNYLVSNVSDDDPTTAWVEGKPDDGIGEFLELNWVPMGNGEISLLNGYQTSKSVWENNNRVKKIKVSIGGKEVCIVELADVMGSQQFTLPNYDGANSKPDIPMRFTILEVYPGLKWKDTAISGIFSCGG